MARHASEWQGASAARDTEQMWTIWPRAMEDLYLEEAVQERAGGHGADAARHGHEEAKPRGLVFRDERGEVRVERRGPSLEDPQRHAAADREAPVDGRTSPWAMVTPGPRSITEPYHVLLINY